MRAHRIVALAVAAALVAGAALAQGFPSLTFDQLIDFNQRLIQLQQKSPKPGDLFFNPGDAGVGRTRAVFTGQARPIDARKHAFIVAFASSSKGNDRYADLYEREYLFTAGGRRWWLPVQSQVAAYFAKELKAGQPVTLYLRNAGGFRTDKDWQWMFLVEEFDGASAPKAPGQPTKPPAKSAPEIPPGPKIAT